MRQAMISFNRLSCGSLLSCRRRTAQTLGRLRRHSSRLSKNRWRVRSLERQESQSGVSNSSRISRTSSPYSASSLQTITSPVVPIDCPHRSRSASSAVVLPIPGSPSRMRQFLSATSGSWISSGLRVLRNSPSGSSKNPQESMRKCPSRLHQYRSVRAAWRCSLPKSHLTKCARLSYPYARILPRQESFASLHILTRRASEGSEALPSLARRVRMSFFGARVIPNADQLRSV